MTIPPLMTDSDRAEVLAIAQSLVRQKSYSGQEESIIRLLEQHMHRLGFDQVTVDSMGNLLGRIGSGGKSILFDSHVDTVEVRDPDGWAVPPFSGAVQDGFLHGRGSVDMKSGLAASLFAASLAKRAGLTHHCTVYVSCSVFEEDCDGENLKHLFQELKLKPDVVVICEPSSNQITLGHKGKAQLTIKTHGISAHGSAPEKGLNAIYEMADIIQRVETLSRDLLQKAAPRGTLVMSRISSVSVSLNAVPSECEVYLDRRLALGETLADVQREMDALVQGRRATWQIGTLERTSWTGKRITYEPFHPAWRIDLAEPLVQAALVAYQAAFGVAPTQFDYWDFSTNAVTTVALGIPTIGFGPGEYKLAHMRDERCQVSQVWEACEFYTRLIGAL